MNKEEQLEYTREVTEKIGKYEIPIGFFLKKIKMSRSHWYFITKGDRPLTKERKEKIEAVIKQLTTEP